MIVDVPDLMFLVTTSVKNVAMTAQRIAKDCVIPGPHFGGDKWIAENGKMTVNVFGRKGRASKLDEASVSCSSNSPGNADELLWE